ncbi:MAG: endonuclease [Bacteroidales bacterium]|nr:endonuclease [Bacteroidales bacterium]
MKKQFILILFFLSNVNIYSQNTSSYYNSANYLYGSELKKELHNIIKNHKQFPYTSKETDVWDILKESDKDILNSKNIILFYSRKSVNAEQEYNSGNGWSREHIWSKSRGQFGNRPGAGTDVHHIRPADIKINSSKNNRWFANCDNTFRNKEKAVNLCKNKWTVEPDENIKGDIARMLFYMAVRYEGEKYEPDLELINYIPKDRNSKLPFYAYLPDLLKWHNEDPIDESEKRRNNIIYKYQKNRNPFIDHPEFAELIWNEKGVINSNDILKDYLVFYFLGKKVLIPKNIESFKDEKSALRTGTHIFYELLKK